MALVIKVQRLSRVELVCRNPLKLADFYQAAFGFAETGEFSFTAPAFARLIGCPDAAATGITLRLGEQDIALIAIQPAGKLYPPDIAGWNPLFQHIAIVVPDMAKAYARLSTVQGWTAISIDGPQILPSSSGGVSAFKFRDPEGHPLELIEFARGSVPPQWQNPSSGECLGIDHSAISVSDSAVSIAFYQDLGLHRGGGSLNVGPEQSKLDDVANAVVEVTALALPAERPNPLLPSPHVELLCYRNGFKPRVSEQRADDATATRLVFAVENIRACAALCARNQEALVSEPVGFADGTSRALLRDPDGHLICLEARH
jgi:catechol 2,3-dioxygenase-like lactoylglutathione lyase family enzyme